jgi:Mor family transcriptional regulator
MSYIKADRVLPKELIEAIQHYIDGKSIYIPSKQKQAWGNGTSAKAFFQDRNQRIYDAWLSGASQKELSLRFALSEKSIQRILREQNRQGHS